MQTASWEDKATMHELGPDAILLIGDDGALVLETSDGSRVALFEDEVTALAGALGR
jgi:hypothetical protein